MEWKEIQKHAKERDVHSNMEMGSNKNTRIRIILFNIKC